jgi:hypothetical protein
MGKLFKTSEDIAELIMKQFDVTGLEAYGIDVRIMSTKKAKDVIKVTKASATTEFMINKESVIQICVYEAALDRLPMDVQKMLIETALSTITFDSERDKLNVDSNPYTFLFNGKRKYGAEVIMNALELSFHVIQEIEEEEKERKEAEKLAKKNKRGN